LPWLCRGPCWFLWRDIRGGIVQDRDYQQTVSSLYFRPFSNLQVSCRIDQDVSLGKDSTRLAYLMRELGIPIHYILFFDTGWEFPQMYNHIKLFEEKFGTKVVRIAYHRSFDEMLMRYGWPSCSGWWCKAAKRDALYKYIRKIKDAVFYIGMTADEPHRLKQNGPVPKKYPLAELGITENEALVYCKQLGFDWDGLYDVFHRVSCRFCPERGISGTRKLRAFFPEIWGDICFRSRYIKGNNMYLHNKSTEQLEARFKEEDRQGLLMEVSA